MVTIPVVILSLTITSVLTRESRGKGIQLLCSTRDDIRLMNSEHPEVNHTILTAHLKSPDPAAFDFDFDDAMVYWHENSQECIRGMKIDGSSKTPVSIVSDLLSPEGLAYDWITKKIYWTDSETNLIEVVQVDGRNRKVLYWTDLDQPRAIVVDPLRGYLFWTDRGSSHKIERGSMDGDQSSRRVLIEGTQEGIEEPNGLTIDYESGRIYWVDATHGKIESVDYDGREREVVVSGLPNPYSVSVSKEHLFWTDWSSRTLNMCNKGTGSERKELFRVLAKAALPNVIHVFDPSRQPKRDDPCLPPANGLCSNLCLLSSTHPGGFSCQCPTGLKINPDGKTCPTTSENSLFIARVDDVRQISLDTLDFTPVELPFSKSIKYAIAVEYDTSENRVYWSDIDLKVIRRAFVNGSGMEDIVAGIENVESLAIDRIAKNLYWSDTDSDRIEVSRLDGSCRRTVVSEGLVNPRSVAVHPEKGFIFWTDWSDPDSEPAGRIERASLDGTERQVIVSNLTWANGLAVDRDANTLYWCDGLAHKIESVSLDGEGRRDIISDILPHGKCYSVAILHDWLYWIDQNLRTVERVNKVTGGDRQTVLEHLPDLFALVAVSNNTHWGSNPCSFNNGNCTGLCFSLPSLSHSHSLSHSCACGNGFKLSRDQTTCETDPDYLPPPPPRRNDERKKPEKKPKNPCHNFGCSHSCAIIVETNTPKCTCPVEQILSSNRKVCVDPPRCDQSQFQCVNGRPNCIPQSFVCNGKTECEDGSDEGRCPCSHPDMKCPSDGKCIKRSSICDGQTDCTDGSDEGCCDTKSFQCNSLSRCISIHNVCDGIRHCQDGLDEETCPRRSASLPVDEAVETHQGNNYTVVTIVTLLVLGLFAFVVYFFRSKNLNQLEGDSCVQDFMLTHSVGAVGVSDRNRNFMSGRRTLTGFPSRASDHDRRDSDRRDNDRRDSDKRVSDQPVYNISSNSSSTHYPKETMNPPPSPVTDHYDTSNSSQTASRSSGYHRGTGFPNNLNKKKPPKGRGPPPTPCSTDFNDESDVYGYHAYGYANSQAEIDPYPPPPTPYFSEASTPPSPCTERSYCNPYPNPPPSPVQ